MNVNHDLYAVAVKKTVAHEANVVGHVPRMHGFTGKQSFLTSAYN